MGLRELFKRFGSTSQKAETAPKPMPEILRDASDTDFRSIEVRVARNALEQQLELANVFATAAENCMTSYNTRHRGQYGIGFETMMMVGDMMSLRNVANRDFKNAQMAHQLHEEGILLTAGTRLTASFSPYELRAVYTPQNFGVYHGVLEVRDIICVSDVFNVLRERGTRDLVQSKSSLMFIEPPYEYPKKPMQVIPVPYDSKAKSFSVTPEGGQAVTINLAMNPCG